MFKLLIINLLTLNLYSNELPRFIDWENAGIITKINYKDTVILNVNPFDDISDILQNSINEYENTLIIIPSGNYIISKTINFKSNIGLKGEDAQNTILNVETNNAINITGKKMN